VHWPNPLPSEAQVAVAAATGELLKREAFGREVAIETTAQTIPGRQGHCHGESWRVHKSASLGAASLNNSGGEFQNIQAEEPHVVISFAPPLPRKTLPRLRLCFAYLCKCACHRPAPVVSGTLTSGLRRTTGHVTRLPGKNPSFGDWPKIRLHGIKSMPIDRLGAQGGELGDSWRKPLHQACRWAIGLPVP